MYNVVIMYEDKEMYLKEFDFIENTFKTTNNLFEAKNFSFIDIKNDFVRMKGKILDTIGVKGVYIASTCSEDYDCLEYLNDYFSCYKWYYEAMYGVPYPENSKGVIFVDSADDVLNEYYQCLENIGNEVGLTIIDRNKKRNEEELNDGKIKLFNTDEEDKCVESSVDKNKKIMTPREIKEKLDEYVIGQDEATKKMAIVAYNHMLMINNPEKNFSKQNILLIGSSGSGKTYMSQVAAKILGVPCLIWDMSGVTASGYIGSSISDIFKSLYELCGGYIDDMKKSIIVLDEICKKIGRNKQNGESDIIAGDSVIWELLRILEGDNITFEVNGYGARKENITINTSKITFVLSGALTGIDEQLKEKELEELNKNAGMGFLRQTKVKEGSDFKVLRRQITKSDLEDYNFPSELTGRISVIAKLNTLTKEDMKNILLNKHGYLQEVKDKFEILGKHIEFSEDFIDDVCEEAIKNEKLGARELNYIINEKIEDIVFNMPDEDKIEYIV